MVVLADQVILFCWIGEQEPALDVFELLLLALLVVWMPIAVDAAAGL